MTASLLAVALFLAELVLGYASAVALLPPLPLRGESTVELVRGTELVQMELGPLTYDRTANRETAPPIMAALLVAALLGIAWSGVRALLLPTYLARCADRWNIPITRGSHLRATRSLVALHLLRCGAVGVAAGLGALPGLGAVALGWVAPGMVLMLAGAAVPAAYVIAATTLGEAFVRFEGDGVISALRRAWAASRAHPWRLLLTVARMYAWRALGTLGFVLFAPVGLALVPYTRVRGEAPWLAAYGRATGLPLTVGRVSARSARASTEELGMLLPPARRRVPLFSDDRGLSTVEFLLVATLVGVAAVGAWKKLGSTVHDKAASAQAALDGLPGSADTHRGLAPVDTAASGNGLFEPHAEGALARGSATLGASADRRPILAELSGGSRALRREADPEGPALGSSAARRELRSGIGKPALADVVEDGSTITEPNESWWRRYVRALGHQGLATAEATADLGWRAVKETARAAFDLVDYNRRLGRDLWRLGADPLGVVRGALRAVADAGAVTRAVTQGVLAGDPRAAATVTLAGASLITGGGGALVRAAQINGRASVGIGPLMRQRREEARREREIARDPWDGYDRHLDRQEREIGAAMDRAERFLDERGTPKKSTFETASFVEGHAFDRQRDKLRPGWLYVARHGSPGGFDIGPAPVFARELKERELGNRPVMLHSCRAGRHRLLGKCAAQELADELDVPVVAPSTYARGRISGKRNENVPLGEWRLFLPHRRDGSTGQVVRSSGGSPTPDPTGRPKAASKAASKAGQPSAAGAAGAP